MKKPTQSLLLFVFLATVVCAQKTETINITERPTSNWPFYFEDFVEAVIIMDDETESTNETKVNINFFTGELQYLDNSGTIRILENIDDVKKIVVANRMEFVFVSEFVQRVVQKGNTYLITEQKKGQLADIQDSNGAYGGSTATSSVNKLEGKMIGGVNYFDYTYMIENKSSTSFKPEIKYFLSGKNFEIPLNKRNVIKQFPEKAKQIASFIKQEKLNLKKEESFSMLLEFLETLE